MKRTSDRVHTEKSMKHNRADDVILPCHTNFCRVEACLDHRCPGEVLVNANARVSVAHIPNMTVNLTQAHNLHIESGGVAGNGGLCEMNGTLVGQMQPAIHICVGLVCTDRRGLWQNSKILN